MQSKRNNTLETRETRMRLHDGSGHAAIRVTIEGREFAIETENDLNRYRSSSQIAVIRYDRHDDGYCFDCIQPARRTAMACSPLIGAFLSQRLSLLSTKRDPMPSHNYVQPNRLACPAMPQGLVVSTALERPTVIPVVTPVPLWTVSFNLVPFAIVLMGSNIEWMSSYDENSVPRSPTTQIRLSQ